MHCFTVEYNHWITAVLSSVHLLNMQHLWSTLEGTHAVPRRLVHGLTCISVVAALYNDLIRASTEILANITMVRRGTGC